MMVIGALSLGIAALLFFSGTGFLVSSLRSDPELTALAVLLCFYGIWWVNAKINAQAKSFSRVIHELHGIDCNIARLDGSLLGNPGRYREAWLAYYAVELLGHWIIGYWGNSGKRWFKKGMTIPEIEDYVRERVQSARDDEQKRPSDVENLLIPALKDFSIFPEDKDNSEITRRYIEEELRKSGGVRESVLTDPLSLPQRKIRLRFKNGKLIGWALDGTWRQMGPLGDEIEYRLKPPLLFRLTSRHTAANPF